MRAFSFVSVCVLALGSLTAAAQTASNSAGKLIQRPAPPQGSQVALDAAHGLEQLEFLRRQRHRQGHPRRRRPARRHRHERRRLHLRQHRRHLGGRARRRRRAAHQRQVPRHEGAGRLRALQGPEDRHLLLAGTKDLRRLSRPRWVTRRRTPSCTPPGASTISSTTCAASFPT